MKKTNSRGKKIRVDWNEAPGIVLQGLAVKKFARFPKHFKFAEDILIAEFHKIPRPNFNQRFGNIFSAPQT